AYPYLAGLDMHDPAVACHQAHALTRDRRGFWWHPAYLNRSYETYVRAAGTALSDTLRPQYVETPTPLHTLRAWQHVRMMHVPNPHAGGYRGRQVHRSFAN